MPRSMRNGTWRTGLGSARPSGSKGSMFLTSVVDGEWGTTGVKRVITSASLRVRKRFSVCGGHRTKRALPILGCCESALDERFDLHSPITIMPWEVVVVDTLYNPRVKNKWILVRLCWIDISLRCPMLERCPSFVAP